MTTTRKPAPPKGLRLFCRMDQEDFLTLDHTEDQPGYATINGDINPLFLDASQLDKLAERCAQWAKYLRTLPKAANPEKKWEDV